jgi:hypothetical protein
MILKFTRMIYADLRTIKAYRYGFFYFQGHSLWILLLILPLYKKMIRKSRKNCLVYVIMLSVSVCDARRARRKIRMVNRRFCFSLCATLSFLKRSWI